jgi:hypothetical protein
MGVRAVTWSGSCDACGRMQARFEKYTRGCTAADAHGANATNSEGSRDVSSAVYWDLRCDRGRLTCRVAAAHLSW